MRLRAVASMFFASFPLLAGYGQGKEAAGDALRWKMAWAWNLLTSSDKDVEAAVAKAASLGFNAMCWQTSRQDIFLKACKNNGVQSFAAVFPFPSSPSDAQILTEAEAALPHDGKARPEYQFGGEPLALKADLEICGTKIACFNAPSTLRSGSQSVESCVKMGYDGIALDFVGYMNYKSCHCPACAKGASDFSINHPELKREDSDARYFESLLVNYCNALCSRARELKPGIKTACHVYPVFLPDILYGNRLSVDYCGQTVSWFFKPHWSYDKIRSYSAKVVSGEAEYWPSSIGAPFIGCYSRGSFAAHRKSPERLRDEIRIVKASGAKAIQIAELGDILASPELSEAVAAELKGIERPSTTAREP